VIEHDLAGVNFADAQRIADPGEALSGGFRERREFLRVVSEIAHRIVGTAMEVEIPVGRPRDAILGRAHLSPQGRGVKTEGTRRRHDDAPHNEGEKFKVGATPVWTGRRGARFSR
jgi:hypothetical protein